VVNCATFLERSHAQREPSRPLGVNPLVVAHHVGGGGNGGGGR
jgi:hypothetical protein